LPGQSLTDKHAKTARAPLSATVVSLPRKTTMPTKTSTLRDEIKQTRPFSSTSHEALVSILRTAAVVQRHVSQVVEGSGVTIQQYNVLRILRGAGNAGLPTLAIRDRMIEEAAGITRLLDKLETAGHVVRERSTPDRRQVLCQITPAGLRLLAALDEPVDAANDLALGMLDDAEKHTLVELLGAVRAGFSGSKKSAAG
jgi:MarR family transcriptional regulator, organic hydroperoxide resistance regulator